MTYKNFKNCKVITDIMCIYIYNKENKSNCNFIDGKL